MYPILFDIAGVPVRSYYVFITIAVISWFIVLHFSLRKTTVEKYRSTMLFGALIYAPFIAGSLLFRFAENILYAAKDISFGEVSLIWGLAVAAVTGFFTARLFKIDAWETGDLLAPSIALGCFFIRLGCLLNGCCFGSACPQDFSFPLQYPAGSSASLIFGEQAVYPVQLMEAGGWLGIFILLIYMKRKPGFKGRQILTLGLIYAVIRFFLNIIRYFPENPAFWMGQIWCILLFFIALSAFIIRQKQR
jgi:phosphatidylglycerol:prolipoprotein diacylglycerol transferase